MSYEAKIIAEAGAETSKIDLDGDTVTILALTTRIVKSVADAVGLSPQDMLLGLALTMAQCNDDLMEGMPS